MGLSARKDKQRIGDDPRNTKWAKNESNPGYKILSSMGWSPSITSLGLSSTTAEPNQSTWKRLPSAILPIIKSSTSGLGANPAQAPSSSYLSGAPRFVRGSQSVSSIKSSVETVASIGNDEDLPNKLAIVANPGANGGGFDDLLGRLNHQSKNKNKQKTIVKNLEVIQEADLNDESFVMVLDERHPSPKKNEKDEQSKALTNEERKRVRILDLCQAKHALNSSESIQNDLDLQPKRKKLKKHKKSDHHKDILVKSKRSQARTNKLTKSSSPKAERVAAKNNDDPDDDDDDDDRLVATSSGPIRISRPINPRVAARAKFIRAKKLASTSANAAAMAEILGIPPPA